MRRWLMTVEAMLMLMLWVINVALDVCTAMFLIIIMSGALVSDIMLCVLGIMHFILNCWLVKTLSTSINRVGLVLLFITQTAPLFLLARRAWLSIVPCCQSDERAKDRRSLRAKYSLCCEVWSLQHTHLKPSEVTRENTLVSCVQGNEISVVSDATPITPANDDPEASSESDLADVLLEPDTKISKTKFKPGSNIIELNGNDAEEIYSGEPSLSKYLMRSFHDLFVDEKRLSHHIVTNSKNKILHVSVSNKHIKVLREPQLCNDTHYMINFTRGHGYEHYHTMKNTCDEQIGFIKTDLSRIIWILVWPSGAIQLFGLLRGLSGKTTYKAPWEFSLINTVISMSTWLVTQRGAGNPWINTLLQIPMRIAFTVCHTVLIVSIAVSSLPLGAFTYISAKALGLLTFMLYLIYAKKIRNVELYSDEVEKYNFQPMYEPVIQIGEGVMYTIWALYWYYSENSMGQSLAQGITISTIVGQICGIVWLWYGRKYLKNPLQHPNKVLDFVQKLEYVRS